MEQYVGYVSLDDEEMAEFYSNSFDKSNLYDNEYIICNNIVYCYQNGFLRQVNYPDFSSTYTGKIKPRNTQQICAFDMLKDEVSQIKLITGKFGSGKTLMLVAAALEAIEKGKFDKIVWVRNNVQVKDTDPIGALPGSELEKMLPYLGPMSDHVGGSSGIEYLIRNNKLEVIPLPFLRGRSIRNSIIISTEAENLTKEHIQLLIGRIDEGSNLWLDADLKQRDRTSFEKSQGIETMISKLKGEKLFSYVHLIKSERSNAAALADKLD